MFLVPTMFVIAPWSGVGLKILLLDLVQLHSESFHGFLEGNDVVSEHMCSRVTLASLLEGILKLCLPGLTLREHRVLAQVKVS